MGDGFESLTHALAIKRAGFHRFQNPENGAISIFPNEAKDVAAWEMRAMEQAARATRDALIVPPKPLENNMIRTTRGD